MTNIVLTGFMGTGKTSVGREVARRLGRPFVDMDAEIETRTGMPISRLFADKGEAAFRDLEAQLCRELCQQQGLVIATGGGTLVDLRNRQGLMASGPVFCLTCTTDGILRRLAAAQDRPLLDVEDRRREVERLLSRRQEAYIAIPRQVDTTLLSVEEVARQVIEDAISILLPVCHPGGQYAVHLGPGLLARLGSLVRDAVTGARIAVVTNETIAPLYAEPVAESLRRAGLSPFACTIPDGEQHKTIDTLAALYAQLVQGDLNRSGTVLALGGGVVCDVAGFAAATYMRGVPVVQVPTTLLAMMDASVGGKTAVDLAQGKNLVGAFKQPALVVIDPDVLDTLPQPEFASGMAELIKHGVLADPDLFEELGHGPPKRQAWSSCIARSLQVKINVVEQDPLEHGLRAVLNLGHTTGHALEQASGFQMRHGEAVSVGMVAAAQIATVLGLAEPTLPGRIAAVLAAHGLPVTCPPLHAQSLWAAMGHDKKRHGTALHWVLPRDIGQVEIRADVPAEVVLRVLRDMGAT